MVPPPVPGRRVVPVRLRLADRVQRAWPGDRAVLLAEWRTDRDGGSGGPASGCSVTGIGSLSSRECRGYWLGWPLVEGVQRGGLVQRQVWLFGLVAALFGAVAALVAARLSVPDW